MGDKWIETPKSVSITGMLNYECSSLRNGHCTNRMLEFREGNIKYILNVKYTLELELVPF